MKNANILLDDMLNLEVCPDDITYNILIEGHCKKGNLQSEKGVMAVYVSYH